MKRIFYAAMCAAAALFMFGTASRACELVTQKVLVTGVIDGHRFYAFCEGDLGPSMMSPKGATTAKPGEADACFVNESRDFLIKKIEGKVVTISFDSIGDKWEQKPDHKHFYVFVEVESEDVGAAVLDGGYGWMPPMHPSSKDSLYSNLSFNAWREKRGLWGLCPEEYLKTLPSPVIPR